MPAASSTFFEFGIIACLVSALLSADTRAANDKIEPVSYSLRAIRLGDEPKSLLYQPKEESGYISVSIPAQVVSEPFHYVGDPLIRFFSNGEHPDTKGERVWVAEAYLLTPGGKLTLIFLQSATHGSGKYVVIPVADNASDLPPGSILIYNASGFQVKGDLGSLEIQLGHGEELITHVKAGAEQAIPVKLHYSEADEDRWRPLVSNVWSVLPGQHLIVVLGPSQEGDDYPSVAVIAKRPS